MNKMFALLIIFVAGCHSEGHHTAVAPQAVSPFGVTEVVHASSAPLANRQESFRQRRCGLNFDGTVSVNPTARKEQAARFAAALPMLVHNLDCSSISVSVFTDGGWFTSVPQYQIPQRQHAPCDAGSSAPSRRVLQPFIGFQQLTNQRCAVQAGDEDRKYERAREEAFAPILTALEHIETVPSSCTDLLGHVALLERISQTDDVDFVLTDGFQTCDTIIKPFPPRHHVVFIIVRSTGDEHATANYGFINATHLTNEFHGSTYLLPAELMAEGWWTKGIEQ